MQARIELVRSSDKSGPPAHMSEHVSQRLTSYVLPIELAKYTKDSIAPLNKKSYKNTTNF